MLGMFDFYIRRLMACPAYGFKAGHEILNIIVRCSQNDPTLSYDDKIRIMEVVHEVHKYLMEVNYNEW